MTREEAREGLIGYSLFIADGTDLKEALNMAIEALSADAVPFDVQLQSTRKVLDDFARDRVKVVRCKDCVWSKEWNDNQIFCDRILMRLRETDFCSYGERREE